MKFGILLNEVCMLVMGRWFVIVILFYWFRLCILMWYLVFLNGVYGNCFGLYLIFCIVSMLMFLWMVNLMVWVMWVWMELMF